MPNRSYAWWVAPEHRSLGHVPRAAFLPELFSSRVPSPPLGLRTGRISQIHRPENAPVPGSQISQDGTFGRRDFDRRPFSHRLSGGSGQFFSVPSSAIASASASVRWCSAKYSFPYLSFSSRIRSMFLTTCSRAFLALASMGTALSESAVARCSIATRSRNTSLRSSSLSPERDPSAA